MSELVKRLRVPLVEVVTEGPDIPTWMNRIHAERAEAADRIEELEAALKGMVESYQYEASMDNPALLEARQVLGVDPD